MKNYIGTNGLVIQDLQQIKDDLAAQYNLIYGADVNLEQNTPDGQLINIAAQAKMDILDLFAQYYNNLDPDRAVGIPQQILYKLNGLIIKAYTYSYCYVDVVITESLTLQGLDDNIESADGTGYTVRDTNGVRWILAESQNLIPGTHTLNFRAADLGEVTSSPNTITVMETIQRGVASVNNPAANYITGGKGESTSEFRLRRNRSMNVPAQGFAEGIESQMLNLTNVTECKVYDNKTDSAVDGIPPHNIWVIVRGGESEDIGRVIYNNLPPGIGMKGSETATVSRSASGQVETVYYDIAASAPLYVKADIKQFTAATIDQSFVKKQLEQMSFEIQEMATTADISTVMSDAIGDIGTPFNIEISTDGNTWSEYATPTGLDEYFTISGDNVTLTVV